MATYVIGDIQGCFDSLQALLKQIAFDPAQDFLWTVGDLVNRGPQSLEVLRFFRDLGERAVAVLGNHDMHLLAVYYGDRNHLKSKDTFDALLAAPDCEALLAWLRQRPLLYCDLGYGMIHAGLPPQWNLDSARARAAEAETILRGASGEEFFARRMYGDSPKQWSEDLEGWGRIRFIINCFTRLRFCTPDGSLVLKKKYAPAYYQDKDLPWFKHPQRASRHTRLVFGHWSTLGFHTGDNVFSLDTGCLWGGTLTAMRLEDQAVFQYTCPQVHNPKRF